jgi:hypothetical protein
MDMYQVLGKIDFLCTREVNRSYRTGTCVRP